jgi:hypothetical protein
MKREILKPRWEDAAKKDVIIATFRYTNDDGSTRDVRASITNTDSNPDWAEIMDTFGEEQVDQITQERLDSIAEIQARREQDRKRNEERELQEQLFDTKLALFEHPIIANLQDLESKRAIRRSDEVNRLFVDLVEAMVKDAFTRAGLEYVAANTATETVE